MSTQPVVAPEAQGREDFMPLHGIDHVELYVGNALQSAYFYVHALGFREVAYAGLETRVRDRTSHVRSSIGTHSRSTDTCPRRC